MDAEKWFQQGVAILVLAAIGFFIWRKGWPFLVKTIENAQAEVKRVNEEARAQMERMSADFNRTMQQQYELQRQERALFAKRLRGGDLKGGTDVE